MDINIIKTLVEGRISMKLRLTQSVEVPIVKQITDMIFMVL